MKEYNGALMQFFHWCTPADGSLWKQLAEQAKSLSEAGITSVWLPPAYKGAAGAEDTGYGAYDLFDLGEFDQKGATRTKYGTRDEYLHGIQAAHAAGLQVYADVVFNHKLGGDMEETFKATPYNPANRNEPIGEQQPIKAWTHFTFPGRGTKYSSLQWHWWHFNAADTNAMESDASAVYLFEGKAFHDEVDKEKGNFDYLMGCNLDIANPDVRKELLYWGEWYTDLTGVDGFRFDAVKHVGADFFVEWLNHMRNHTGRNLFAVGEYWSGIDEALEHFLKATDSNLMLFDAGLHYSFAAAGREEKDYDLRTILDRSLVKDHPDMAVTLVSNHDTQPLQSLESVVEAWFKPLGYAIILLRRGGYPCVFFPDYYGADYSGVGNDGKEYHISMPSHKYLIDCFLHARRTHAFGEENDYLDHPNCIGWTRTGNSEHPGGLAVLLSNDADGFKSMNTGSPGITYSDATEHIKEIVTTNSEGWGEFKCKGRSVSVWIPIDESKSSG
ncbi:MAG: alpha-amylase [Spirochaetales bacterium]|nr:alpha-amylase [Spirochaetales bacterium]MCF7938253.1 alpha-amylase [Spirochaetales bacterium]